MPFDQAGVDGSTRRRRRERLATSGQIEEIGRFEEAIKHGSGDKPDLYLLDAFAAGKEGPED
jgi:hypothetical protein